MPNPLEQSNPSGEYSQTEVREELLRRGILEGDQPFSTEDHEATLRRAKILAEQGESGDEASLWAQAYAERVLTGASAAGVEPLRQTPTELLHHVAKATAGFDLTDKGLELFRNFAIKDILENPGVSPKQRISSWEAFRKEAQTPGSTIVTDGTAVVGKGEDALSALENARKETGRE